MLNDLFIFGFIPIQLIFNLSYFSEMALAYMEQTKQRDKLEESLLNLRNGKKFNLTKLNH